MKCMNKKKKPVINLYINGGCGNQFFQYAFARQLQEKLDAELVINYSYVLQDPNPWAIDNLLNEFHTSFYRYENKRSGKEIFLRLLNRYRNLRGFGAFKKETFRFYQRTAKWLPKLGIYYYDASYHIFPLTKCKNIIVMGYFESAQYFRQIDEKIKKELTPRHPPLEQNRELLRIIGSRESVCITIKRYDLDNPQIHDIYEYNINYFYTGIDYMKKHVTNPVFIIFADNIDWCRKNLRIDGEVYFETENNPIWEKIRLMSSCKHFIIHNSTFSWWAQHLSDNADKIVLAPVKWLQRDDQPIDLYEPNWLYITPTGEIVDTHE